MLWRGIGTVAAIAGLGLLAGHIATADDEPQATHAIRVGAATLTVAGGWHAIDATTLANGRDRMRVVLGPPADASLIPAPLRDQPASGTPTATRLGGYRAWSYGAVTVLPTTRGVLGLACDAQRCASAIRSLSIAGAAILAPTPDLALRLRAPALLATLDAARVSARSALKDASPTQPAARLAAGGTSAAPAQANAPIAEPARRLAAAHRAALDGLRPVAGPALTGALASAEQSYDRLANASSATSFNAARAEVIAADRAVDVAVAGLARAGAPAVQRPPAVATSSSGGGASARTLLLVLAIALLVSALAPAAVRRVRTRTRRAAPLEPASAGRPCLLAPLRRSPIAPPPTYGRWNEAPRGPSAGATVGDGDARAGAMASSSTT